MRYFISTLISAWQSYYEGQRNTFTDTYPPHAEGAD